MVQNVQYLNGRPRHVTLPFEYWTPILSGIQVSSIQIVTLVRLSNGHTLINEQFLYSICIACLSTSLVIKWRSNTECPLFKTS